MKKEKTKVETEEQKNIELPYSGELRKGFLGPERREETDLEILDRYSAMKESGEIIEEMSFETGERAKGLSRKEGGVTVIMPTAESILNESGEERLWIGGGYLDRVYAVKVVDVDYEAKVVTVSHKEAQAQMKGAVISSIKKKLEEGKHPIVKARVISMPCNLDPDPARNRKQKAFSVLTASKKCPIAILDIEGLSINGTLSRDHYADCFIPDLAPFLQLGDVIDVAVTAEGEPYRGKDGKGKPQTVFLCSREEAVPSCWENLDYKVGQNVVVRCISKQEDYWTGITDDRNITFKCLYPRTSLVGNIKIGAKYFGRIDVCEPEKRQLRVYIIKECKAV